MQQDTSFPRKILPLFLVFVIVNSAVLALQAQLNERKIDSLVVFNSNCLLFALSVLTLLMFRRAMNNTNPNVFFRSVMGATMIKLLVLGSAALIYLFMAGHNRSVYAIFVGMFLYIVYTVIEIRIALKLNQKK